jgi:HEAT repeat protein
MPVKVTYVGFSITVTRTCDSCGIQEVEYDDGRDLGGALPREAQQWLCGKCKYGRAIEEARQFRLRERSAEGRREAAELIGIYGQSDEAFAVKTLWELTEDPDAGARLSALGALARLKPEAVRSNPEKCVAIVFRSWGQDHSRSEMVLTTAGHRGLLAAFSGVGALPSEGKVWLLQQVAKAAERAPECLEFVRRMLHDDNSGVRREAAVVAARFRSEATPLLPDLIACLQTGDRATREAALWAIGDIGAPDRALIDRLVLMLTDPDANNRANAAVTFGKLRAAPPRAIENLGRLLADEATHVRVQAAYALMCLGACAHTALPDLQRAADDPSKRVRQFVSQALQSLRDSG